MISRRLYSSLNKLPNVIFVLGGPGCGKGTQCTNLEKSLGYVHLSAGELLRAERDSNPEFAKMFNEYSKLGKIVPVEISCTLLEKAMKESGKDTFLIDGFPRNQDNLDGWNRQMGAKANVKSVLYFECLDKLCIDRCLKRGRGDDTVDTILKRIKTFHDATIPIVKHFENLNLLKRIDASKSKSHVFEELKILLKNII